MKTTWLKGLRNKFYNCFTKIHHTMLLSKHGNLLIALRSRSPYLSTNHKIILDPFLEVRTDLTHCKPKTKYGINGI